MFIVIFFFLSRIPFLQRLLKFLDPVDSSFSCFHCAESGQCTTISRARIEEISLFVCKPSGEENSPNGLNEKGKKRGRMAFESVSSLDLCKHCTRSTEYSVVILHPIYSPDRGLRPQKAAESFSPNYECELSSPNLIHHTSCL